MNRKGDLFMLGLNVLFLVAIILVFWKLSGAFRMENDAEGLGTRQTALLQTYATAEQMLLTIDTEATLAAYEAQETLAQKGVLDAVSGACGTYAGYTAWTSEGKDCTPSRDEIDRRFATETLNRLRLPASFPPLARYTPSVTHEDGMLVLRAVTDDRIELPILTAKGSEQSSAASAVRDERAASIARGGFAKDTSLDAEVLPAQRRETRASPPEGITIITTDADVSAFADGETTVHYYVGGGIVQLVPEAERATACDGICVAVEDWSSKEVARMLADIVTRHDMDVERIAYAEDDDRQPTLRELSASVVSAQHAPAEETEGPAPPAIAVAWPTTREELTSCWGPRGSLNDFHDGIDMPGEGNPVFAYADGTVLQVCDEGGTAGCGGYGRYIIIAHPNGLFTRYSHLASVSVRRGDTVSVRQAIGRVGNAGRSTGPHLDFKVYTSEDFGPDKAKNPLCFFPEEMLDDIDQAMRGNCKYARFSLTDPQLKQECEGIDTAFASAKDTCTRSTIDISASGDAKVTATIDHLKEAGVYADVVRGAESEGVDPRLAIALIAQETCVTLDTCGTANLVSATGCAGLGQFCYATATGGDYADIFGPGVRKCDCPGAGSCTDAEAGCAGDPRFDASKSARAISHLLKENMGSFTGKSDQALFAVASYNAGAGTIKMAMQKAGGADPSWESTAAALDASIIERALCPNGKGYFCSLDHQEAKVREVRTYVARVAGYYAAQGGSTPTAFSDVRCEEEQVTVKGLGTYAFRPSFTVSVPDALTPVQALAQWVRDTVAACDGASDNRACLASREEEKVSGVAFVPCSSVDEHSYVATRYRAFVADCEANRQDACGCVFDPNRQDVSVRLYGDEADVWIDGVRYGAKPLALPVSVVDGESGAHSLEVKDGARSIVTWGVPEAEGSDSPFVEMRDAVDVDAFTLYKDGDSLSWTTGDVDMCGVYKTTHLVCARLDTKALNGTQPVVRIALHLSDAHPPDAVSDASAIAASFSGVSVGPIAVKFSPSASDDVSYYTVSCSGISTGDSEKVLGRTSPPLDKKIDEEFSLELTCAGLSSASTVTIVPYDISGNEGTPTVVQVKEATDTGALVETAT